MEDWQYMAKPLLFFVAGEHMDSIKVDACMVT